MSVIIVLLIASLSVALVFLGAFIWGVRNRQFEDDYAPPLRILFEDASLSERLRDLPSTIPDLPSTHKTDAGSSQKHTSSSNSSNSGPKSTNQ